MKFNKFPNVPRSFMEVLLMDWFLPGLGILTPIVILVCMIGNYKRHQAQTEKVPQLELPKIRVTSKVELVEALFRAARNPSHKNCGDLGDILVEVSVDDATIQQAEVHLDEDMLLLREFLTTECKDGVDRK